MTSQNEQLSLAEVSRLVAAAFARSEASRLPKHVRLYDAISAEIDARRLSPGQKLPGERELCAALDISLGTAQKGLSKLVADGHILREHGRGTFVRAGRSPLTDLWHYRFRDPADGALLPVFATLHERVQVLGDAGVRQALGVDRVGYVRVSRIVHIADRLRCWSDMYLPFGRFGGLLELPREDIESVNLKELLARKFDAPTLAITQTAQVRNFTAEVAPHVGVKLRSPGLLLQIVGTSRGGLPITFQRIHVPPSECEMEIGAELAAMPVALSA